MCFKNSQKRPTFLEHVDGLREAVDVLLKALYIQRVEGIAEPLLLRSLPLLLRLPEQATQRQVPLQLRQVGPDLTRASLLLSVHHHQVPGDEIIGTMLTRSTCVPSVRINGIHTHTSILGTGQLLPRQLLAWTFNPSPLPR